MQHAVAWLPWVLLGTDAAVRNPKGWGGPGLALASACAMSGGQLALQVLLASGLFGVWRTIEQYGWRLRPPALRAAAVLTVAWAAGMMLATPDWLHLRDYSRASARLIDRAAGYEDRSPAGLSAIPQVVLPDIYGSHQTGSFRIVDGNRLEGSAAAYVGLLAVLVLVPIGLADRRRRGMNGMWLGLTLLSLAWVVDLPGLVSVMRLPGLKIIAHNRSVFIASFTLLAVAVAGLDRLRCGAFRPRKWCLIPVLLLLGTSLYCGYRVLNLPEPIATHELAVAVEHGRTALPDARGRSPRSGQLSRERDAGPRALSDRARALELVGAFACSGRDGAAAGCADGGRAALVWQGPESTDGPGTLLSPRFRSSPRSRRRRRVGFSAWGVCRRGSPRATDSGTFAATTPSTPCGWSSCWRSPSRRPRCGPVKQTHYARLQWYVPKVTLNPSGSHILPPVLDMLNVRYLIVRRFPITGAPVLFDAHDDYWVLENRDALPRVYVPERVESKRQ